MAQADIDEAKREGLSTDEKAELVRLRRENRTQAMEIEILKRASAYFARENVLPKQASGSFVSLPPTGSPSRWRAGS